MTPPLPTNTQRQQQQQRRRRRHSSLPLVQQILPVWSLMVLCLGGVILHITTVQYQNPPIIWDHDDYNNNNNYYNNNNNNNNNNSSSSRNRRRNRPERLTVPKLVTTTTTADKEKTTTINNYRSNTSSNTPPETTIPLNTNNNPNTTTTSTTTTTTTSTSTSTSTTSISIIEDAIQAYRDRVQRTNSSAWRCRNERQQQPPPPSHKTVNVTPGLVCLSHTLPHLLLPSNKVQYPLDAEEHYNEIRYRLAPFAQHDAHIYHTANGYAGPWIENQFMDAFETTYDQQHDTHCLPHFFGPYIPIFIPWTDHQVQYKYQYPPGMIETLLSVLRPNVLYVTVNQNARGLKDFKSPSQLLTDIRKKLPHLVILSAGGHGHVPIPLLMRDEAVNNHNTVIERPIDVSYVGSLGNAPNNVRQKMHDALLQAAVASSSTTGSTSSSTGRRPFNYTYYYGPDWRDVMAQSKFSLVPRGFGRTAYHLMETWQMGLVPIYVYLDDDVPWIPYRHLVHDPIMPLGYSTTFGKVVSLVQQLVQQQQQGPNKNNNNDTLLQRQEARIIALRASHFSRAGIVQHVSDFFTAPERSDLECQALPKFVTGVPKYGT